MKMVICRNCNIPMQNVMSFSHSKNERFNKCPKCYSESKHIKINENELNFGEYLHREITKGK